MWLDLLWRLGRPLLFGLDAETAHELVFSGMPLATALARLARLRPDPRLQTTVGPMRWAGPVGLAAGLDKEGAALDAWEALGFGAMEIGTVTARAQPGNPRPRLYRLVEEAALINRMGFNNGGAAAMAGRLRARKAAGRWPGIPVGINVGKSKLAPLEAAVEDYLESLEALRGLGDYVVLNVSSPNTAGLRALQERTELERLLAAAVPAAGAPVFLKLAPDLEDDPLAEAVEVAVAAGCAGIIATNTTISRPGSTGRLDQAGGLSGAPLAALARQKIGVVIRAADGRVPVIGVGGIATAADVRDRLAMGCAAVQLYTAFIYGGPRTVARIHAELARA